MKRPGTLTVVVIGGYGTFGGRLCDLLSDERRITLIVGGRSFQKAQTFCRRPSSAKLVPAFIDRGGDLAGQIATFDPDIVVDASGPFQAYGKDAYVVVAAALAAGADYLDFADGSEFVAGIRYADGPARTLDRFVLSGVSSFPVLTAAVVRALAADLTRVDAITAGIAPSPYAGIGANVIRAIASYSGKRVRLMRDGKPATGYGLAESLDRTIMVPGAVPLGPIRFSLVDVPDLTTLPKAWPTVRDVWMGAGPVPRILHRLLNGAAWLVRLHVLPSLLPIAGLMNWAVNHVRWGEHRGGMFVEVVGVDAHDASVTNRWFMLAEGDAGPLIPSMAAEVIIRACLDGRRPTAGARPADRELELADYERQFALRKISSAIVPTPDADAPLYRQLLGPAYEEMSAPLRVVHETRARMVFRGKAAVERGRGVLARIIGWVVGFPPDGGKIPVSVTLSREGDREVWARDFDGHRFQSVQYLGTGRHEGLMVERFGPIEFAMAMVVEGGRLHLVQRKWSIFGVPMPRWLLPTGDVYEHDKGERFNFHVEVTLPLVGLVVFYRGWLEPAT